MHLWLPNNMRNGNIPGEANYSFAGIAPALARVDVSCITQLQAQGPARTCNESKEEEEEVLRGSHPHSRGCAPYSLDSGSEQGSYLRLIYFWGGRTRTRACRCRSTSCRSTCATTAPAPRPLPFGIQGLGFGV